MQPNFQALLLTHVSHDTAKVPLFYSTDDTDYNDYICASQVDKRLTGNDGRRGSFATAKITIMLTMKSAINGFGCRQSRD